MLGVDAVDNVIEKGSIRVGPDAQMTGLVKCAEPQGISMKVAVLFVPE